MSAVSILIYLILSQEVVLVAVWFREEAAPGHAVEWQVRRSLFSGRSDFQTIDVLELESFGRALVLDGIMQTTTDDEFIYHEMLAHVPLLAHPAPRRVLIIGGGDGGLAREVLRHQEVRSVVMVEIDRMVVEVAKKFLPAHTAALGDLRLVIHYADGAAFLRGLAPNERFDVILVDSTDPEGNGPGNGLYTPEFYRHLRNALSPGGIFAQQTGTPFFNPEVVQRVVKSVAEFFAWAGVYWSVVPSYPGGFFTFTAGSLGSAVDAPRREATWPTVWYTGAIHRLAFSLPPYLARSVPYAVANGAPTSVNHQR